MFLHYFKKFPEKGFQLEIIAKLLDKEEKEGTVIDTIIHPLNYVPKESERKNNDKEIREMNKSDEHNIWDDDSWVDDPELGCKG